MFIASATQSPVLGHSRPNGLRQWHSEVMVFVWDAGLRGGELGASTDWRKQIHYVPILYL